MIETKCKGSQYILAASGVDRDVLTVLLRPDDLYTQRQVDALRKKFLGDDANGRR